jgi:hypothetical protein
LSFYYYVCKVIQDGIKVSASTFINLDFLFSSLFIEKQVGPLSYTILLEDQPRPQGLLRTWRVKNEKTLVKAAKI